MIKNWVKFLESSEDGYSDEFDADFDEIKSLVDKVLDEKEGYQREVLELMNKQELLDILAS